MSIYKLNLENLKEESWNPITGCTPISTACDHCWAKRMAHMMKGRYGYDQEDPFKITLHTNRMTQPTRWTRPRMIITCFMSDFFHEEIPTDWRLHCWNTMATTNQHVYMVLTKRPWNALKWYHLTGESWPSHVMLGYTAWDDDSLTKGLEYIAQISATRYVSLEPLLGLVPTIDQALSSQQLHWVIVGGESGPESTVRPIHPNWVRPIKDACVKHKVPFMFKQWGEWVPFGQYEGLIASRDSETITVTGGFDPTTEVFAGQQYIPGDDYRCSVYRVGKPHSGRLLDGQEWMQYPKLGDLHE